MRFPFSTLSSSARRTLLLLTLAGTVSLWFALSRLDVPLRTQAAPNGIVSFELAGSIAKSAEILASWDSRARVAAGLSLGIDYLFLVSYSVLLALAVSLLSEKMHPVVACAAFVGLPVAWLQLVAGALDAFENFALIKLLLGSTASAWSTLARSAALLKFGLVSAGITYLVVVSLWFAWAKRKARCQK